MSSDFINKKKELLKWISELQDEEMILEILKIKDDFENLVNEPKAEYIVTDDFEERWARGISHVEMKRRTKDYISNLPWKM